MNEPPPGAVCCASDECHEPAAVLVPCEPVLWSEGVTEAGKWVCVRHGAPDSAAV